MSPFVAAGNDAQKSFARFLQIYPKGDNRTRTVNHHRVRHTISVRQRSFMTPFLVHEVMMVSLESYEKNRRWHDYAITRGLLLM